MSVFLSMFLSIRKGLLVLMMLLYSGCMITAAREDLKSRRISKRISCILLSCSLLVRLLTAYGTDALLSFLLVGLQGALTLFLLVEQVNLLTHFKGIGGGDIRLILAGGFVLGPDPGLYALLLSLILAVAVTGLLYAGSHMKQAQAEHESVRRTGFRKKRIPLGPYLAAGFLGCMWVHYYTFIIS